MTKSPNYVIYGGMGDTVICSTMPWGLVGSGALLFLEGAENDRAS